MDLRDASHILIAIANGLTSQGGTARRRVRPSDPLRGRRQGVTAALRERGPRVRLGGR